MQCLKASLYMHLYTFTVCWISAWGWFFHVQFLKRVLVHTHVYFYRMLCIRTGVNFSPAMSKTVCVHAHILFKNLCIHEMEIFHVQCLKLWRVTYRYSRAMSDSNILIYAACKKSQGKFSFKTLLLFSLNRFSSADVVQNVSLFRFRATVVCKW